MNDELQRLIGQMQAQIEALTRRVGRQENAWITIGAAAVALIVGVLVRQAGVF